MTNSFFRSHGDQLMVGDVPVARIVEKYGTPLFVYDQGVFGRQVDVIREAFSEEFSLYYSVKANPNPLVIKYFVSRGCGLEIASGGELYVALSAGCRPEKILYAGPGKTEGELEYAVDSGIGEFHVESFEEVGRLSRIAASRDARVNVAVRVNPSGEAQGGAMRMGGKPAPFGFDEEILEEVIDRVSGEKRLDFSGIHLFAGTQILDHEILLQQYSKGVQIAKLAASIAEVSLRTVDFGGGLGIPYFPNETALDMGRLRDGLKGIVADARTHRDLSGARFIIEPGRFLVGEAGVYVTRVNAVKTSRGKKYLVLDGGMNHHLAASGNLGQVIKRNFPVAILNRMTEECADVVDLVGPLCTPLDSLARNVRLPPARVGDLVGVFQSGAYARSASPMYFLSHCTPPEILVDGERFYLIRRRGEIRDSIGDVVCDELGFPDG